MINTDEENAARTKDFVSLLSPVRNEQTRAIFVFLRRSFAEHVFAAARKLGMLEAEWAWIVTEPALQASNIPQGIYDRLISCSFYTLWFSRYFIVSQHECCGSTILHML